MPAYNIFGWQRPCYLLQEGYANSYKELLEETKWEEYGVPSGNPSAPTAWSVAATRRPRSSTVLYVEGFLAWCAEPSAAIRMHMRSNSSMRLLRTVRLPGAD